MCIRDRLDSETCAQYGVKVIGRSTDLVEEFFAVSVERRITHPCVAAITQAARSQLFRTAAPTEPALAA